MNLQQQEAYDKWDRAWHAIVDLKKRFAPNPVPLELRGTLEADCEVAAKKLHHANRT